MIQIRNLTKYYGDFRAVDDISFDVRDGEILGFLGPNGAGKTTTLKMITCFMPPSSGEIKVNDFNVRDNSMEIRKLIGYLPENAPIYEYMSVMEYLDYICDLREIKGDRRKSRIDKMIHVCGLEKMIGKNIGDLSKGYRQRVGIAQAMIHEPELLILDEPTVGLDPNQIVEIRNLIKNVGKEKTVMLSTHILSEVEATCDRVVIISSGEIVADGSTETLRNDMAGQAIVQVALKGKVPDAIDAIWGIDGVDDVRQLDDTVEDVTKLEISVKKDYDIRENLFRKVVDRGWVLYGMQQEKTNLEEVFRMLTKTQGGAAK